MAGVCCTNKSFIQTKKERENYKTPQTHPTIIISMIINLLVSRHHLTNDILRLELLTVERAQLSKFIVFYCPISTPFKATLGFVYIIVRGQGKPAGPENYG